MRPFLAPALVLMALCCVAMPARADGLADLKGALARSSAPAPLKARIESRLVRRHGEGKDAEDEQGEAALTVEDSARGVSMVFDRDILARIEAEKRARVRNPNSKTPTTSALAELAPGDVLNMVSPAQALLRTMDKAVYKGERGEAWQGKAARVLSFDIPISTLAARELKYTKQFESGLEVWIGADGTPLASRMRQKRSGRAFVVVSFEANLEESSIYGLTGERLVTLRREFRGKASGAGESDDTRTVTTLVPQP